MTDENLRTDESLLRQAQAPAAPDDPPRAPRPARGRRARARRAARARAGRGGGERPTATSSSTPSTARPASCPTLPDLRAAAGGALVEVTTERGRRRLGRALEAPSTGRSQVGGRCCVRPPWDAAARRACVDVVIDPGQAFGTGAHPTTRLCLELLLELEPGGALVDVGCGSGVLAIAAARLGWAPVLGVDHERESVQATLDNAAANGVAVQARRHDLLRDGPAPGAPTVLANLLRPLLLRVAADGFAGEPPRRARRQRAARARGRRGRRRVRAPRPARGRAPPRRRVGRAAAAALGSSR